ncbi:MAG: TaqI-like C-terminal specificity domain-containing protein [Bernardetiaceae bacterium]
MQTNIFGSTEEHGITLAQAAEKACVSVATVRNWIKTGYLSQTGKGLVSRKSFDDFMLNIAGKEKLNSRANKLSKNEHRHTKTSLKVSTLLQDYSGEDPGTIYENSLADADRNREGIYYTPTWVIKDMFRNIEISKDFTFLDPCCGSGNFLVEAIRAGVSPENVYGYDTDKNAVQITKARLKKEFDIETSNICVGDFLEKAFELKSSDTFFDLVFTNPPWGKKIDRINKKWFADLYNCGNSLDTTALFMGASLSVLKQEGILGFLVQEAFFNISTFEFIRRKVANKKILRLVDYGKVFKGLITKAQAIIIENTASSTTTQIECTISDNNFTRDLVSFRKNPKNIFNFWTTQEESRVIDRLYAVNHITLQERARWALGIVTGNNKKYCLDKQEAGYIPIYKGSDITKTGLKNPSTFIVSDFTNFQQVAPLEIYQAKEKLIYKFISSDLCFYHDTEQRYILNSANLLIPFNTGITGEQLAALLNSQIMNWLFKKIFSTHKILRSDLELLPIHTAYFSERSIFSEYDYLDYLQVTKTKYGTFSIKG